MAEPYLFTNPQPSLPSTSELTPLNSCPLLAEDAIFARLDPAARAAYLAARTPLQEQASLVDLARRHYENPQPESQDHAHLNVPRNEPQSDDMVHGDDSCDEDLYSCSEYSYISHISDVTIDVDTTDVLLT